MLYLNFLLIIYLIFADNIIFVCIIFSVKFFELVLIRKYRFIDFKKLKFLIWFLVFTGVIQLFFNKQGEIFFYINEYFYITYDSIKNFMMSIVKIVSIVLVSWTIDYKNIFTGRYNEYRLIVEAVIEVFPDIGKILKEDKDPNLIFNRIYYKAYKIIERRRL